MRLILLIIFCLYAAPALAVDSPFKKAAAPHEEKILDIQKVENTNPKKLLSPDEEEAEKLARETVSSKNFDRSPEQKKGESGLPIPRFVSLKSGEVNARSGPGETYPIQWIYQRKNLPVEVDAEFKQWRRIRDIEGEKSWVHQALLRGERYAIFEKDTDAYAEPVFENLTARFRKGVQVKIRQCKKDICLAEYGEVKGWVEKDSVFGIYDFETFD